jgi:GMP synthase PP-ATPase subunit
MALLASIQMTYMTILEDVLHLKMSIQQCTLVGHTVAYNSTDFIKKWAEIEDANGRDDEFKKDMVDVFCKAAKEMKLKRLDRDTITRQLDKMIEEGKKAKSDNNQDN